MATFTVADASYTHHDAIGNNVSIPDRDLDIDLPGDAEVGDLIVMGFAPLVGRGLVGALVDAPDYSLVPGGSSDPTANGVGAYGVTSDLSSVTVTARYGWGVDAMVVALRDVVSGPISTTSIEAFTVEEKPTQLDETDDVSDLLAKLEASVKKRQGGAAANEPAPAKKAPAKKTAATAAKKAASPRARKKPAAE